MVVAGEVALEAAHGLHPGLALGFLARQVGAGRRVDPSACDRDDVQTPIDLAVATAVQAMPVMAAGGDGYRCDAGESCKVGVALEALCASGLADQDRGGQRTAAGLGEQRWTAVADQ